MYIGQTEEFERAGLKFRATVHHDSDMGHPWDEHDGHGIIRDIRANSCTGRPEKRAGETVIAWDRGRGWAYDVQATTKKARAERWGLGDAAPLIAKLGRDPTAGEVTAEAVRQDLGRMRDYLDDRWYWCGVVVELLDLDGDPVPGMSESLWGIESDSDDDYFMETAEELADTLADSVGRRRTVTVGAKRVTVRARGVAA